MSSKKNDSAELQNGADVCGHVNRQYYNIGGELASLSCIDKPGHTGDHSAPVQALRKNPYPVRNPRTEYLWREGAEYEVYETIAVWSSEAGTPADQVKPDYEGLSREEWVNRRTKEKA